jgi:putative transposase
MNTPSINHYKNHRYPVEIISHAVWLYFRFCLSYRDVEELLLARGVRVTYQAIRQWCRKFGQQYANQPCESSMSMGNKLTMPWAQTVRCTRGKGVARFACSCPT